MIDGKFVLAVINYFLLSLILIFGIISLVLVDQRKKLTFLFLMYISAGIASFLFFTVATFALAGIVMLLFFLLLFTHVFQQEFFGFGKNYHNYKKQNKYSGKSQTNIIVNLVLSIIFCIFIGYLFYRYTQDFYKSITMVKSFSTPVAISILDDIGSNYIPVILLVIFVLTSSFIWFIGILPGKKGKN
ncbi:MAG: hypothetical protein FJW69_01280 [Actinobacteria bacterium]|nr:hypothetical protein [Actinomycetota bacterium]